jgi:predicted DCC family thiol-disulfide oxidoreductase YuxK
MIVSARREPLILRAELVFDGRCGFCTRVVYALKRLDYDDRLCITAWQEPTVLERNGLCFKDVQSAAWLIVGDRRLRGAAAINAALAHTTGIKLIWWFYSLPGIHHFQDFIYGWITDHRHLLRGIRPRCLEPLVDCSAKNL